MKNIFLGCLMSLLFLSSAVAHPGRTNAKGCHKKEGSKKEHCHKGTKNKKEADLKNTKKVKKKKNLAKKIVKKKAKNKN